MSKQGLFDHNGSKSKTFKEEVDQAMLLNLARNVNASNKIGLFQIGNTYQGEKQSSGSKTLYGRGTHRWTIFVTVTDQTVLENWHRIV